MSACHYGCGRPAVSRDHVIPRSRRGCVVYVQACVECNQDRSSAPYPDYAAARGVALSTIRVVMLRAMGEYERLRGVPPPTADEAAFRRVTGEHYTHRPQAEPRRRGGGLVAAERNPGEWT